MKNGSSVEQRPAWEAPYVIALGAIAFVLFVLFLWPELL